MRALPLFLCLLLASALQGKDKKLDSLKELVNSSIAIEHARGMIGVAEFYIGQDSAKAMQYLKQAQLEQLQLPDSLLQQLNVRKYSLYKDLYQHELAIQELKASIRYAKKNELPNTLAANYKLLSSHYFYLFQYDSCKIALQKAIELYEKLGDESARGSLLLRLAGVDYALGLYEPAIIKAFEAAEIFKKINSDKQLAVAYMQLGNIYYFLESFDEARAFYSIAADYFEKYGDDNGFYNALSNIGLVKIERREYQHGIEDQRKALAYFHHNNKILEAGNAYFYLGKAFHYLGKTDSSEYFLDKSIESNTATGYKIGVGYAYLYKARNKLKKEEIDEAIALAEKALSIIRELPNYELEQDVSVILAECYEKKNLPKKSLSHLKRAYELMDSLAIDNGILTNVALHEQAKLEKAEYELKLAKAREVAREKEYENQKKIILLVSLIALIAIASLNYFIRSNRKNRYLNRELKAKQKLIEEELATKRALLKEIHHRVKNNLQVISSMLSIQSQYIKSPELENVVRECRARISSMSLIHESLYRKEDNDQSLFSSYVKNLIPQLVETYQVDQQNIRLEMDIQDFELSLDDSVPCGLLINEIVSNSLKHAFPDGKGGTITIQMHKTGNRIDLIVADDGVGINKDVKPEEESTFGFLLIYSLISQLEAELDLDAGKGTRYHISWESKSDKLLN